MVLLDALDEVPMEQSNGTSPGPYPRVAPGSASTSPNGGVSFLMLPSG